MSFGFPKSCFEMQDFDFGKTGVVEPQLDLIPALLTMAFYPNIYSYKENRKVIALYYLFLVLYDLI
jgi:hypothetical protein